MLVSLLLRSSGVQGYMREKDSDSLWLLTPDTRGHLFDQTQLIHSNWREDQSTNDASGKRKSRSKPKFKTRRKKEQLDVFLFSCLDGRMVYFIWFCCFDFVQMFLLTGHFYIMWCLYQCIESWCGSIGHLRANGNWLMRCSGMDLTE